jgi:exopolysaccharide production protein ExoQ
MRPLLDRCYVILTLCSALGVFARVFGGHAMLHARGDASFISGGDRNPVLLGFNLVFACATFFLAGPKLPQIIAVFFEFRWLLLLYLYAATSIMWSSDRPTTFRTVAYLLLYLVAAAYIAICFEYETLVQLIGNVMTSLALLSIPGQLFLPQIRYNNGEWAGVFLHKNGLGIAMVVGTLSLILSIRQWTMSRVFSLLLCFALLLLSGAVGAYFWALAGITALMALRLRGHLRVLFAIVVSGALIVPPLAVEDFLSTATGLLGKDASLTGRTAVWAIAAKMIMVHPWLGYGEAAFWSTSGATVGKLIGRWQPQHAHNGVLEMCLNLGLVGLCLVILVLLDSALRLRHAVTDMGKGATKWLLAISVILVVQSADEAAFLQLNCLWILFVIANFALWRAEQDRETELCPSRAEDFVFREPMPEGLR